MTYVFDIDGTICSTVDSNYLESRPFASRIKVVNDLYDKGNTIIFQTARGMGRCGNDQQQAIREFKKFTEDQLEEWGVKYHSLYLGKPSGDLYVDDKGINDKQFSW